MSLDDHFPPETTRVAGLLDGQLVTLSPVRPPARRRGRCWRSPSTCFSTDPLSSDVTQEGGYHLPAGTLAHRFPHLGRAEDGDLLMYDDTAEPDVIWRVDALTREPSVMAPQHRPLASASADLGISAAPRFSGSTIHYLSSGPSALCGLRVTSPAATLSHSGRMRMV